MNLFSRKKKESKGTVVQTAQRKINSPLAMFSDVSSTAAERELFRNLRKSVPVIDAAICKLIRLLGTFTVTAKNSRCQQIIDDFMSNVCTNGTGTGINGFVYSYMESLLTYGEAVGEWCFPVTEKELLHFTMQVLTMLRYRRAVHRLTL